MLQRCGADSGADSGTQTRTLDCAGDFKSPVSTIPPCPRGASGRIRTCDLTVMSGQL